MSLAKVKPETLRFEVKDFERRFAEINWSDWDDRVSSDEVADCRGNKWTLYVGPDEDARQRNNREDMNIMISFGLENKGMKKISAQVCFVLRDSLGEVFCETYDKDDVDFFTFEANSYSYDMAYELDCVRRSEIFDKRNNILVNGSLHIDAMLRFEPEPFHVPGNPLAKNMLELFYKQEHTDLSFQVGSDVIPAHKFIIDVNAPLLASFIQGNDPGVPIVIKDMAPDVFLGVLTYIYGGDIEHLELDSSIHEKSKDFISAADRFGLVELKLAVEAALVREIHLTKSDAIDWLLFADAKTCPLLKEYAMAYVVARSSDCLHDKSGSLALKQSPKLMEELMIEISRCANTDRRLNRTGKNATVDELRKMLNQKRLDVDGSREMLLSRLNESNKRQRTG